MPELLTNNWEDEVDKSFFHKLMAEPELVDGLPASFALEKGFAEKQKVLEDYLRFGGYPAISRENIPENDKFNWLLDYVKTYLERDVRDLAEFRNLEPFVRVQQMCSLNTGQNLNYSKLAGEAGVSAKTVQRFIEYLFISYQVILLRPWYGNRQKRLVRSPKLHFIDPGIQFAIIQKKGGMTGAEFESAVIGEIYKQIKTCNISVQIYHLRTFDGREIDLLLESDKGYFAFEIKMGNRVTSSDARHLRALEDILDKPLLMSIVLSNDPAIKKLGEKIYALPVGFFLM